VLLFNKNFSLDESRKKGKKKVNCQSFTPFFLSAFVPFSFPTFFMTCRLSLLLLFLFSC
jgi:hypothetical protein